VVSDDYGVMTMKEVCDEGGYYLTLLCAHNRIRKISYGVDKG